MPNVVATTSDWLPRAALIVLAVTTARIALMAFNRTDLFVDEAQYWFWGQEMAFGYYSKPPLIGWVIRGSTELAGSDAPFWVRLPAPLFHAVTALLMGTLAARLWSAAAAIWVAAIYITLPMVTVGSYMISTDTVMFPFITLGLLAWLITIERGGHLGWAVVAGAAVGVGFLAKYAAIYMPLCAALAALAVPRARPGWAATGAGLLGFMVAISPNVLWNIANGLTTVQHTLDNADWVRDPGERASLNVAGLAEFLGSQFAVVGPVLFGALIWLGLRRGAGSERRRLLLWFCWPIVAIVCVQATLSGAYANWAAAAYLGGVLAAVPWLLARPGWLWGSLALHGAFALLIPMVTAIGTGWAVGPDDRLLLARYLGRTEMSRQILQTAAAEGLPVVADDRDVLADLFYTGRDGTVQIYARPVPGRAPHHYALRFSLPSDSDGPVLFVTRRDNAPALCGVSEPRKRLAPQQGAYRDRPQTAYVVDTTCLIPLD